MAPIVLKGTPKQKRNHQREQFNAAVKALAPIIATILAEGVIGVEKIRARLNADGIVAPNGGKFSNGSVHRVQRRLLELGLGPKPRSVSRALYDRGSVKRKKDRKASSTVILGNSL